RCYRDWSSDVCSSDLYSFWVAPGKIVKRRVAPKALETLKERLREITSRTGGRSLTQVVVLLRSYLVGWKAYFRLADTPNVFLRRSEERRVGRGCRSRG